MVELQAIHGDFQVHMVRLPKESNTLWKDDAINQKKWWCFQLIKIYLVGWVFFFLGEKSVTTSKARKKIFMISCLLVWGFFGSCHNPYIFNHFVQ